MIGGPRGGPPVKRGQHVASRRVLSRVVSNAAGMRVFGSNPQRVFPQKGAGMRMAVPVPQRVTRLPAQITRTEEIEENMRSHDSPTDYDVLICYNMLFGQSESSWDISWSCIDKPLSENTTIQSIVTQEGAKLGDICF